jgi:hypothetical protein
MPILKKPKPTTQVPTFEEDGLNFDASPFEEEKAPESPTPSPVAPVESTKAPSPTTLSVPRVVDPIVVISVPHLFDGQPYFENKPHFVIADGKYVVAALGRHMIYLYQRQADGKYAVINHFLYLSTCFQEILECEIQTSLLKSDRLSLQTFLGQWNEALLLLAKEVGECKANNFSSWTRPGS